MRMLTYYQDSNEANHGSKATNYSSRDSNDNSFLKRRTSADFSNDTTANNLNLKTDNVYKPFKEEKTRGRKSFI